MFTTGLSSLRAVQMSTNVRGVAWMVVICSPLESAH